MSDRLKELIGIITRITDKDRHSISISLGREGEYWRGCIKVHNQIIVYLESKDLLELYRQLEKKFDEYLAEAAKVVAEVIDQSIIAKYTDRPAHE